MKKSWIIIIVIVVLVFIGYSSFKSSFNAMNSLEKEVDANWAKVENSYQRRLDLIPNLVSTVKGFASHEKETLEGVIEARSKATSTTIDAGNLNPQSLQQFQAAQDGLSSALSRLMVVVERYPDLKANQNFMELQAQLEGTENRISVARNRYIDKAKIYNEHIDAFPQRFYSRMFGFEEKAYFTSQQGAETAPKVEF